MALRDDPLIGQERVEVSGGESWKAAGDGEVGLGGMLAAWYFLRRGCKGEYPLANPRKPVR